MASRRLVLLRHAKAEQGGRDRDRALAARGRADAAVAGRWLATHETIPDLAVVSPARRTVQTWEAVASELPAVPDVLFDERIYDNHVDDLLDTIRGTDADVRTLLLVGHNPSTHALALHLCADEQLEGGFPTATLAVFDVAAEWSELDGGALFVSVTTCRA